jgi:excisionase family DNA binding protein
VTTQERWLIVEEVARRLDVTEETVRRLLRRGELPGMQISKRSGWRVRAEDVDVFIRSRFRTGVPSTEDTEEGAGR